MYTKVFITLMVILFILGIISGCILYFGFDPSYYPAIAFVMMGISCVLSSGSLIGLLLLLSKKITTRGFLYPIDAFRSFRHGILFALLSVSLYIFAQYQVLSFVTGFLLFCIIFFLEIILTKIEDV